MKKRDKKKQNKLQKITTKRAQYEKTRRLVKKQKVTAKHAENAAAKQILAD